MVYSRRRALAVITILMLPACVLSQPRPRASSAGGIRRVDFLNFTYHSQLCSKELKGIPAVVRVHAGEFKTDDVYFGVLDKKVLYGDVTGDGIEEAIVTVGCGETQANFGFSEVFVYAMKSGTASLLASLNDDGIKEDYVRYYPNGDRFTEWWGIRNLKTRNGALEIDALVDGSHAMPQYVATLIYRWDGRSLSLNGKPRRQAFRP